MPPRGPSSGLRVLGACGESSTAVSGSNGLLSSCNNLYALSAATGAQFGSNWTRRCRSGCGRSCIHWCSRVQRTNGSLVWSNPTYSGGSLRWPTASSMLTRDPRSSCSTAAPALTSGSISYRPSSDASFDGAVIPVDGRVYVCSENTLRTPSPSTPMCLDAGSGPSTRAGSDSTVRQRLMLRDPRWIGRSVVQSALPPISRVFSGTGVRE